MSTNRKALNQIVTGFGMCITTMFALVSLPVGIYVLVSTAIVVAVVWSVK